MITEKIVLSREQSKFCREQLRVKYNIVSSIQKYSEFWVLALLKTELEERRRRDVVERLYTRYCKVRKLREKMELREHYDRPFFKDADVFYRRMKSRITVGS